MKSKHPQNRTPVFLSVGLRLKNDENTRQEHEPKYTELCYFLLQINNTNTEVTAVRKVLSKCW